MLNPLTEFLAGAPEIVFLLQTEPEIRAVAKITGKAECSIGCDGTAARNDSSDAAMRDTRIHGETILSQIHFIEELRAKDFAGVRTMNCLCFCFYRFLLN